MIFELIKDAWMDCVKMLPFLFGAFLILELIEHHAKEKMNAILAKVQYGGPLVGAVLGCIPQCGFSVVAAGLYSGGVITLGTLISVFLATSDEAILILLGNPQAQGIIFPLIGAKVLIGAVGGYLVDILGQRYKIAKDSMDVICAQCGCRNDEGILKPALRHTGKIFFFLFLFSMALGAALEFIGTDTLSALLLKDTIFQPFLTGLIGMIPNCAASILVTELYMSGMISFGSAISGLCTGAGLGILVLFKMNPDRMENLKVIGILYGLSVLSGLLV